VRPATRFALFVGHAAPFAVAVAVVVAMQPAAAAQPLAGAPSDSADAALPEVKIDADTMRVMGQEHRAVFTGKVRVTRGEDRLDCLRLTVHYDAKGAVESFVADGKVRMTRGNRRLRADRAELDNRTNIVTLTGDPVMEEGRNVIRGEVMRYDVAADEIEVQHAKARVELDRVVGEVPAP